MNVDWKALLVPDTPIVEIVVRGSAVYLALFWPFRVVLKRQAGSVGLTDILLVVLVADAAQNAMADDYRSLPDGLILVATLVFWNYALDWLAFRVPAMRRLIRAPALPLVQDGQMLRHNMRRELVTAEELFAQLREQGVDDLSRVKSALMESDGTVSVVQVEPGETAGSGRGARR